jgi:hypothetical protein
VCESSDCREFLLDAHRALVSANATELAEPPEVGTYIGVYNALIGGLRRLHARRNIFTYILEKDSGLGGKNCIAKFRGNTENKENIHPCIS